MTTCPKNEPPRPGVTGSVLRRWLAVVLLTTSAAGALGGCGEGTGPGPDGGGPRDVPADGTADLPGVDQGCERARSCAGQLLRPGASELQPALAGASPGDCVVLPAGSHGDLVVPDGVSLLGEVAPSATAPASAATIEVGDGSVLECLTVRSGVTVRDSARQVTIAKLSILGGMKGLRLGRESEVTVEGTAISGADTYGIVSVGGRSLTLLDSVVSANAGPGLWFDCDSACEGATVVVRDSTFDGNQLIGLALIGALEVELTGVTVKATMPLGFDGGGGMTVAGGAHLVSTDLRIEDNASYGLLIDGASAELGTAVVGSGGTIEGNLVGFWVQGGALVKGENLQLDGNLGVGLGVSGAETDVTLKTSRICRTQLTQLPTLTDGLPSSEMVADAVQWRDGATVRLVDVSLCDNQHLSLLIDGPVGRGSLLQDVTLDGIDAEREGSMVLQSFPAGGAGPEVSGSSPPLTETSESAYPVAAPPSSPAPP